MRRAGAERRLPVDGIIRWTLNGGLRLAHPLLSTELFQGDGFMKIYIASSWKNADDVCIIADCLRVYGHEVDCFCDESTGRYVFHYSEINAYENLDAINFMQSEQAQKAFAEDKKWLDWADGVLLYLPAGRSAHLEAGYAAGQGKFLVIYQEVFPKGEFDVMYGFADLITDDFNAILEFLKDKVK